MGKTEIVAEIEDCETEMERAPVCLLVPFPGSDETDIVVGPFATYEEATEWAKD